MGIQLWTGFNSMQTYYKSQEIPTITPEEVKNKEQQPQTVQQNIAAAESVNEPIAEDNRSKTADLENISLTFNKDETFDYIGSESGLAGLDMQKAISDMKKDAVLQEYQYFVGSSKDFFQPADGMVIPK